MNSVELEKYIQRIRFVAGKQNISYKKADPAHVESYFTKSNRLYRRFHSPDGAIHVPLTMRPGQSHREKLLTLADEVRQIISGKGYGSVLELGCGMGFNLNYLAGALPEVRFTGVDLTAANLKVAINKSENLQNVTYVQSNYDQPDSIAGKFDFIFALETLCYSANITALLRRLCDHLNPGGTVIVFDGFVTSETPLFEPESSAWRLFTWGFSLNDFPALSAVKMPQFEENYTIRLTDYTEHALEYSAFGKASGRMLRFPILLRLARQLRIVSPTFIRQIAAGIFLNHFLASGYCKYLGVEMSKK